MIISNQSMQGVLEHLKYHTDDFTSYLVLGDLLEENGQIEWAVTLRWLAVNKKSPQPIGKMASPTITYKWHLDHDRSSIRHSLRVLRGANDYSGRSFPSFLEAIVYAHKLLKKKRKLFTIPGDVGYGV